MNSVQEIPSITNIASRISRNGEIFPIVNKKKIVVDVKKDDNSKDKNFVEMTKVKIILERNSP
jgi:hypothetical protein